MLLTSFSVIPEWQTWKYVTKTVETNNEADFEKQLRNDETNVVQPHALFAYGLFFTGYAIEEVQLKVTSHEHVTN